MGIFQIGELVRHEGWTVEEVSEQFGLDREQTRAVLEYYDTHPELVDTLRAQHRAGVRSVRDQSRAE